MGGTDLREEDNPVSWLILGYLCSHPDAKDTAEGVGRWWLHGRGIDMDADMSAVNGALDYLASRGWLNIIPSGSGKRIYGLNQARRNVLRHFL